MPSVQLYFDTVRYMKLNQIIARMRGIKKVSGCLMDDKVFDTKSVKVSIPTLDLDEYYLARFDISSLMKDEYLLLNERYCVENGSWGVKDASHLWNFNLHYFEYAIALCAAFKQEGDERYLDKYKCIVDSWIENCEYPKGDAWHPYTISLRLINWKICRDLVSDSLDADKGFIDRMNQSMYQQYRHLLYNQEKHLLANHYFENLKTLVIFSKLFGEEEVLEDVWSDFERELNEQILPDGVHYERSLMYHKLVFEGLLRVAYVLEQTEGAIPDILIKKMQLMLDAMVSLEKGMGKTPFFNDSADGVAKECSVLAKACEELFRLEPNIKKSFPFAGYYKLYDESVAVMFDAGESGPAYMLGHSHCDALSIEVSVDGDPLFVNSGTYAYQSKMRSYFRSTRAHNTATVDNCEQNECWGEHRVARRLRDVICRHEGEAIVGSCLSYSGDRQTRTIKMQNKQIIIEDVFKTRQAGIIRSFLHISPQFSIAKNESDGNIYSVLNNKQEIICRIKPLKCNCTVHRDDDVCHYSPEFGVLDNTETLEFFDESACKRCAYLISIE